MFDSKTHPQHKQQKNRPIISDVVNTNRHKTPKSISPIWIRKSIKNYGRLVVVGLIIFVAVLIATIHNARGAQDKGKAELDSVIGKVSRLIVLPENETPSLATITDKNKLKADSFLYKNGRDGDKVLIYVKAGRVIIYRPAIDKVVNIGPVVVDQAMLEAKDTTILLEDSTNRLDVAQKIQAQVQAAYPTSKVILGNPTNRQDFPNTIVIDNTDKKDNLVDGLDSLIKAQRGVLPLSEPKPNADILIIIGQDYQ